MARTTLRDIADQAGVSLATVSAVLSGQAETRRIASQTAEKIWRIGRQLGYEARQARASATHNVGVILRGRVRHFLGNAFYGEIFHGIQEELERNKFNLFFSSTQETLESSGIPRVLSQRQVDGLIILGQVSEQYLAALTDFGALMVCVHFDHPTTASVVIDGEDECTQAMAYLASRGHRRIAYLASNTGSQHSRGHEMGYRQNLAQDVEPIILRAEGADEEHGRAAITAFLEASETPATPFTCVLAENDTLAAGAIEAFQAAGLKVPDDVSVMGGQDLEVSGFVGPQLTTTFVDKIYIGKLAVNHLISMIADGRNRPLRMIVPTRVIERQSVAPISRPG